MRHHGFSGDNQLFKQRMPEHHQPGLPPQRAQVDEQALPVPRAQRVPQGFRRLQQGAVFVEHRERIAQGPAHRAHALGGKVDEVMMRIVDTLYSLPFIFFVILLMVTFGKNIFLIFLAIGAVEWLTMSRIVRARGSFSDRPAGTGRAWASGVVTYSA